MLVFDTNALLRYILQDNDEMANSVEREIFSRMCFVPTEVIAEMTYVLNKVYKIDRNTIACAIKGVLSIENITVSESNVVLAALEIYISTRLDFVDCMMVGYAKAKGYTVFTFDKELKKYV